MEFVENATLETISGEALMLTQVEAFGDLRGLMLDMHIKQHFCNSTNKNVEVVYTFPLAWGSVLLGVDVQLGSRKLHGVVVGKATAESRYEGALSEGDAAIMLERNIDESYTLNIGNLAPKETCLITLRYAQALQFEQSGLRVLIPTVISPRYGDPISQGGLKPHQTTRHSLLAEYPFNIELKLHSELARARVASPSHPICVAHSRDECGDILNISLARRGALDRDFVLIVDQISNTSLAILAHDFQDSDSVVTMLSFRPQIDSVLPSPVSLKILVDCSGSMEGDSITAARNSLLAIVNQFSKGDRYSLSRFGSSVEHRSRALWHATEATGLASNRWITALDATLGGTEMESALESTFSLPSDGSADVLLITDGEIDGIETTITSARKSRHRLFIVGIGSNPAESHLRRLARATGGACDFVAPGENVEPAILRMFARLRSPLISDIQVAWPAGCTPEWTTHVQPWAFDGDTVHAFAKFKHSPSGEACLIGSRRSNQEREVIGRASLEVPVQLGDLVSRMAVSHFLTASSDEAAPNSPQDAAGLAEKYQLITEHTNFVLVHERVESEKAQDMPELHKVAQMIPAGWSGLGSVVRTGGSDMHSRMGPDDLVLKSNAIDAYNLPPIARSIDSVKFCSARYDIPAFLKVADKPTRTYSTKSETIDRNDGRYWSQSEFYDGLTPLGLSEWLQKSMREKWPKTYEDLRMIGLGSSIIDWLELSIRPLLGRMFDERDVVRAFLSFMSHKDLHDTLTKSVNVGQRPPSTLKRIADIISGDRRIKERSSDDGAIKIIADNLENLAAINWPDRVFAMDTA